MGNNKSIQDAQYTILDETRVEALCFKTKLSRDEILKLHSEFIVRIEIHF
jgi:hypothetical protein